MSVVAEKTGYPTEMLEMDMSLEADLGIDSIKRVEILSTLREKAPELPELDAATLGKLRTLGQILEALPGASTVNPKMAGEEAATGLARTVLEVVALGSMDGGARGCGPVTVVRDQGGLADRVHARLLAAGVDAILAEPGTAIPAARGLVFVRGVDPEDTNREAFQAVRAAAKGAGATVVLISRMGGFGLSGCAHPSMAGLGGLAKTLKLEEPDTAVLSLDLEPDLAPDLAAAAIVDALLRDGPVEVAVGAAGARYGLREVAQEPDRVGALPAPGSVFVVSGGARGVTAHCLVELARQCRPRLAILGRSAVDLPESAEVAAAQGEAALKRALLKQHVGMPLKEIGRKVEAVLAAREARENIAAMRAAGAEVRYLAVDVTDPALVAAAVAQVRAAWGPIRGLIHAAGVIQDKRIAEKTDAQFDLVYQTKVGGLHALLTATLSATQGADLVETVILFSSIAGRSGNVGQCDYAMANEVLNRSAAALSGRVRVVRSIGWGPWEGGMVTAALKRHFESQHVPLIPLAAGARAMALELRSGGAAEVVIGGGLPAARPARGSASPVAAAITGGVTEQQVSRVGFPWLADHAVADRPVLPVVLALEWLVSAAERQNPGSRVTAVRGVSVLKGIALACYENGGDTLRILLKPVGERRLAGEIRSPEGWLHYRAELELAAALPAAPSGPPARHLPEWEIPASKLYEEALFHGPELQVIRSLGADAEGLEAELSTPAWSAAFLTDPAAMDGALQLALLWNRQHSRSASLPTGIAEWRRFDGGAAVRCCLKGRMVSGSKVVVDMQLLDAEARVCGELRGVETYVLPGGVWPGRGTTARGAEASR